MSDDARQGPLKDESTLLEDVLESLTHPFYVVDARDYTVLMANSAAGIELSGQPCTCHGVTHGRQLPCDGTEYPCTIEEVKKHRKPVTVEHVHYDREGNARYIEIHAYPIFDSEGNVAKIIEYNLDVTDRKRVEDALRDSEMRARSVAQSATDAIISVDSDDTIIFWNKAAQKIFGYSEKEILGKPISTVIPEQYREAHREGVKRYLRTKKPVLIGKTVELQGLRKGRTVFPVELSLSTWQARGRTFFSGIIRDISNRKEAEKALEQRTEEANQRSSELESLIQMVAHDLKSPVVTIGGLVRLLKNSTDAGPADSKRDEIIDHIIQASRTMEHFLGDLLNGLAIDQTQPELARLRLDEVIREVLLQHKQALDEKGIVVRMDIPSPSPVVHGDKRRIAQVVDNLLANAIKYMGEKADPQIAVDVFEHRNSFLTRISDNGVGIPREYHSKIFDRFFRVPRSDGQNGTGLGLAIVRKIVESHGGAIWVDSEEGKGATFYFTLPKMGHEKPGGER
jgi:PAS domain S-box-containing protein